MKSTFAAFAAALLLAVAGCGGEQENMQAQYPPPPGVSTDAPAQDVAASEAPSAQAQMSAEANSQAYAQPQQGDIQVGVDANANSYEDTDPGALTDFKTTLDPYGTWREDATYGTVWTPSANVVGTDFAPYQTAGHWAYDDDYVWVSDYEWGWAPFHYGRWVYVSSYGWSWIPGRVYSGAWVTWRYGYYDDLYYVGWAPLPPTWYWYGGVAVGIGYVPVAPYVFCRSSYLFAPTVAGHVVTGAQVPVVASHTRPYVPAAPAGASGGGRVAARPTVGGPPPGQIGLKGAQIPRSPVGNRGLMHAQAFANPTTATQMGARAPQTFTSSAPHTFNSAAPRTGVGTGPTGVAGSRAIGGNAMPSSHAPVATAPQYRGVSPTPYRAPSMSGPQHFSSPQAPSYSAPHYAAPSYSAPHYSTPAYSAPHYSAPSSPSFHSSAPSMPSYHPTVPSYSAPSRPSGGGGGFHGGGARGRR